MSVTDSPVLAESQCCGWRIRAPVRPSPPSTSRTLPTPKRSPNPKPSRHFTPASASPAPGSAVHFSLSLTVLSPSWRWVLWRFLPVSEGLACCSSGQAFLPCVCRHMLSSIRPRRSTWIVSAFLCCESWGVQILEFLFPVRLCIYPGGELLSHMAILPLIF